MHNNSYSTLHSHAALRERDVSPLRYRAPFQRTERETPAVVKPAFRSRLDHDTCIDAVAFMVAPDCSRVTRHRVTARFVARTTRFPRRVVVFVVSKRAIPRTVVVLLQRKAQQNPP